MRTFQTSCLPGSVRKSASKLTILFATLFFVAGLFFSTTTTAQSSPAACRSGCTSNDVQIIGAYLSDANGVQLANYVCGSGVPVYLTLQLTTNTPRVGVSIYSVIKKVVSGTPTDSIGFVSQCFGNALNTTGSIVTFSAPINWTPCGVQIALTGTYTAWGTGNTNFCTSNNFQCGGTPSKCHAAQAGEITIIQVPQTQTASATHCSDLIGSYSSSFDLTALQPNIITNSTNYNFKFYNVSVTPTASADTAGNMIANPSSFSSTVATKTIYAYVCSKQFGNSCSWQAVTLNINSKPAAAAAGDLITCAHPTALLSGSGSETTGVNYLWSGAGTVTNSSLINATTTTGGVYTLLVTNSTTGCTASATASVSVNNSAPTAVAAGDLITCSHTTGSLDGTGSSTSGVSYLWTGPGSITNSTSINASTTTGGLYTLKVTITATGCTATATASVSVNNSAPTAVAAGDLITCSHTTGSLDGTGSSTSGVSYLWTGPGSITNSTSINASTTTGGLYTLKVTITATGCTATATASVSVNNSAPTFTITAVQPSLCTQYGSVTITPTIAGNYHFSIDNGTTFTNTTGSFTNLASGSVSGIKIRSDATGCTSDALSCGTTNLPNKTEKITPTSLDLPVQQATVKAYPNPFSDRVKFIVNAPIAGNGSLEIYNVMGQKIKTVYQGRINAGNQTFEMTIPKQQQETLIYVLRVDGKKVTGKLLQLNN